MSSANNGMGAGVYLPTKEIVQAKSGSGLGLGLEHILPLDLPIHLLLTIANQVNLCREVPLLFLSAETIIHKPQTPVVLNMPTSTQFPLPKTLYFLATLTIPPWLA